MQDKRVFVFKEAKLQKAVPSQCREPVENANVISISKVDYVWQGLNVVYTASILQLGPTKWNISFRVIAWYNIRAHVHINKRVIFLMQTCLTYFWRLSV